MGAQGGSSRTERDLARLAVRLYDRQVRASMAPRPKMVWLNADDSPEENQRLIAESRHSYYPVARGDLDELLGVASIEDALAQESREGRPTDPLGSLLLLLSSQRVPPPRRRSRRSSDPASH